MMDALVSTLALAGAATGLALPLAVAAALFLHLYAPPGPARALRTLLRSQAAFPSVIVGLVAMAFLVLRLGLGFSFAAAALTLAALVAPGLALRAEDALAALPPEWLEGALALGATPPQAALRLLLPAIRPALADSARASLERVAAEAAAVLLTAGTHRVRTLATHVLLTAGNDDPGGALLAAAVLVGVALVLRREG